MRYKALVCDYDRTLSDRGSLDPRTVVALRRLRASGRKVCIVTGRRLDDLARTLTSEQARLFDVIVAENGGVVWWPGTGRAQVIAPMVAPEFVRALHEQNIPADIGITGVHVPLRHAARAAAIVQRLALPVHAIVGSHHHVYVADGVDKAYGLRYAMHVLGLQPADAVTMGDGHNDVAMLDRRHSGCGQGIAVANAVPAARQVADRLTEGRASAGVREVIDALIAHDLSAPQERGGLAA